MTPIQTLIADDHPAVRQSLRSMLETARDVQVVGEASDAAQAVRWAARHDVDVVLLDLHLPGRDGIEAIRRIKARRPAATVVMLAEHNDDASVIDAVLAGASGYLLKDASRDLVVYTIRAARGGGTLIKTSVLQDAMASLLSANGRRRPSPAPDGCGCEELTGRELEVLELVADGLTNKEVAKALFIADDTAKKHVQSIIGKMGASDRTHAVMKAARAGLIR